MVDPGQACDSHLRKLIELLSERGNSPDVWTAWDAYVDDQPRSVADDLRRRPDIEAVRLMLRSLVAKSEERSRGTPYPEELKLDLRRAGRLGFPGDRQAVADTIRSLVEDILAYGAELHRET